MNIKVAHHIFASVKGYQTQFRSPDITESENAELESFSFGQTNDADYIISLKDHPAFVVRKLRSGRWAFTRVFQGSDDEYGRVTLMFHTVLLDQTDWLDSLGCDIQPLLDHPMLWQNTESTEISVKLDNSPLPQNIQQKVRSLLDKATMATSTVLVDESACSLQTIRWAHRMMLDEEKESFSYGYRVLSDAMNVSLLCLAHQALRASTPGRGQRPTAISAVMPPDAPSQANKQGSQYDYGDSANEENTRAINMAILVIIAMCVLGISGAIFAFIAFQSNQNAKIVDEILQSANSFIEETIQTPADPNVNPQDIEKAQKFIKELSSIDTKIKSKEMHTKKEKCFETISVWLKNTQGAQNSEKKEKDILKQIREVDKYIKGKITVYPNPQDIEKVNRYKPQLKQYIVESNPRPDLESKIKGAIIGINQWNKNIESPLNEIETNLESIQKELNSYDTIQYQSIDINQNDDGDDDPNKLPLWADPTKLTKIADDNIKALNKIKQEMDVLGKNISLTNAINSPIQEHKEEAEILLQEIKEFTPQIDFFISRHNELKDKGDGFEKLVRGLAAREKELKTNIEKQKTSIGNLKKKSKGLKDKKKTANERPMIAKLNNQIITNQKALEESVIILVKTIAGSLTQTLEEYNKLDKATQLEGQWKSHYGYKISRFYNTTIKPEISDYYGHKSNYRNLLNREKLLGGLVNQIKTLPSPFKETFKQLIDLDENSQESSNNNIGDDQ